MICQYTQKSPDDQRYLITEDELDKLTNLFKFNWKISLVCGLAGFVFGRILIVLLKD